MSSRPTCSACRHFKAVAGPLGRCEALGVLVQGRNVACVKYEVRS